MPWIGLKLSVLFRMQDNSLLDILSKTKSAKAKNQRYCDLLLVCNIPCKNSNKLIHIAIYVMRSRCRSSLYRE